MHSLKPEGSSPSRLSEIAHLSIFQQAVYIEQIVLTILSESFPGCAVQAMASRQIENMNWRVHVQVKSVVSSFELDHLLQDWDDFWSMLTEIKLSI